jgi:S1-C subfamily serine protease
MMSMGAILALLILAGPPTSDSAAASSGGGDKAPTRLPVQPRPRPYCTGTYADTFSVLSNDAIELSNRPEASFAHCVRNVTTYECLSYAPDGTIRRTKRQAISHGTAFAYKRQSADTLLLTNQHVAEYTAVTDEDHVVANVPSGCKRIGDSLKIVDNEKDTFEGDDIPLARVVIDLPLDIAVVRARAPLAVMPWKIGRSSALRERNVVEVKGFPLGAFRATAQGRVTSVYDHDDFRDWNHDDFVIDAQLSAGNSGSPVLAVNCESGEYELVGIFHADYSRGNALNVVVHVDEVRELMTTLKRSGATRAHDESLTVAARRRIAEEAHQSGRGFFPFGQLAAEVRDRAEALLFTVLPKEFPAKGWPAMVLEDAANAEGNGFGRLEHIWFGNARGLKEHRAQDLDEADRLTVEKALEAMRRAALAAAQLRSLTVRATISREAAEDLVRVDRELKRLTGQGRDLSQAVLDAAERLGPASMDEALPAGLPFSSPQPPTPEPTAITPSGDMPTQ